MQPRNAVRSSFRRNVMVLAGGTATAQMVTVLAAPLISRLYLPDEVGVFVVYATIVSILLVVASARYELAIPLALDERQALSLVVLGASILFVVVGILTAVTLILPDAGWEAVGAGGIEPYSFLLSLSLAAAGVIQIISYWAIRQQSYPDISWAKVTETTVVTGTQIGIGVAGGGIAGLLIGDAVGRVSGGLMLGFRSIRTHVAELTTITRSEIKLVAARFRRFPLISSWAGLVNSLGIGVPFILFAGGYGLEAVGWFGLTLRVLGAPTRLVGQAVAQAYFGAAAELQRSEPDQLRALFRKTSSRLLLLGLGPSIALVLIGPWAFDLVFGGEWRPAGEYAQVMAVMLLAQFVVTPLSQTLNVVERQGSQLLWDIARLVMVSGTLLIMIDLELSPLTAVAGYAISMTVAYVALFFIGYGALGKREAGG